MAGGLLGPGSGGSSAVTSVAGKTGAVTLAEGDITNLTTDLAGKAATSHTHAEGDITNLTTDLAAAVQIADRPYGKIYLSAQQNGLGAFTDTAINLNTSELDSTSSFVDTTNHRLVVPTGQGGIYLITAAMWCFGANATALLIVGGTDLAEGPTTNDRQFVSTILQLAAGTTIALHAYPTTACDCHADAAKDTWLSAVRLA